MSILFKIYLCSVETPSCYGPAHETSIEPPYDACSEEADGQHQTSAM